MDNIAGSKPTLRWVTNISALTIVLLWLFPTVGLLVSSFRTVDQISTNGWWKAPLTVQQSLILRTATFDSQVEENGSFIIKGNLFAASKPKTISAWGISSRAIDAFVPGDATELNNDGGTITVAANGDYLIKRDDPFPAGSGQRVFVTAKSPPEFTLANYDKVLFEEGNVNSMGQAFLNTFIVTIPATIIPILFAAFAAYALAWMACPGRVLLIALVVALLVVPLQLALIPLLRLHLGIGIGKGYLGVWLAHTGFGLPLAIYLLRNYMVGLPRDLIECARIDGATDYQIFTRLILPLSFPALASFAIFQFLWTWNDLLVAKVFLIDASGKTTVMTARIVELLGTRGGNWEILATSAFVSIAVPLMVFFTMQKYLVRGLLAGSVK